MTCLAELHCASAAAMQSQFLRPEILPLAGYRQSSTLPGFEHCNAESRRARGDASISV